MRQELDLLQAEVAEGAGISVRHLRDIESGRGNPTLDILLKLQAFFELDSIESLLGPTPSSTLKPRRAARRSA